MFSIVPVNAEGKMISRGVVSAKSASDIEGRIGRARELAKSAVSFKIYDKATNTEIDPSTLIPIAAMAHPALVEDDVAEDDSVGHDAVESANAAELAEPKITASSIIAKYLTAGKPFIRKSVLEELAAHSPGTTNKQLMNTLGALMSVLARKNGLSKKVETVEIDGKKVKMFTFSK